MTTTNGIIDKDGRFKKIVHPAAGSLLASAQGSANLHQRPTGIATQDPDGTVKVIGVVHPSVNGGANTISSIVSGGGTPPPGVRTRIQARSPFARRK
jgi:hypothetical protein